MFDDEGRELTERNAMRCGINDSIGRELGTWGDGRLGFIREAGTTSIQVGDPTLPDSSFDTSDVFVQFFTDEVDDVAFPRHGTHSEIGSRPAVCFPASTRSSGRSTSRGVSPKAADPTTIYSWANRPPTGSPDCGRGNRRSFGQSI